MSTTRKIQTPLTEDVIASLHAGDMVLLSGEVYTARDAAHRVARGAAGDHFLHKIGEDERRCLRHHPGLSLSAPFRFRVVDLLSVAVRHVADGERLHRESPVGDGGDASRHFQRRQLGGAQGESWVHLEPVTGKARDLGGEAPDPVAAHLLVHAHGDDVERLLAALFRLGAPAYVGKQAGSVAKALLVLALLDAECREASGGPLDKLVRVADRAGAQQRQFLFLLG